MKKLQVLCSNKKFGCDYIGELEKYFRVSKYTLPKSSTGDFTGDIHHSRITYRSAYISPFPALTRRKDVPN